MTSARLARIEDLFEQMVDQPCVEQRRLLEAACGQDATLIADVMTLLRADASAAPSALRQELASLANYLLAEGNTPAVPSRFGKYTVLDFLGQGGMGRVYLAEREGLGDRVAVKFLLDAWTSPERRERFAREQRMLAGLNHPHIARLYDAGVEDGTPWFAMEHVKGVPINMYCQANPPRLNRQTATVSASLRGHPIRALQPDRASRSEAFEHSGERGRRDEASRLRNCQKPRSRRA